MVPNQGPSASSSSGPDPRPPAGSGSPTARRIDLPARAPATAPNHTNVTSPAGTTRSPLASHARGRSGEHTADAPQRRSPTTSTCMDTTTSASSLVLHHGGGAAGAPIPRRRTPAARRVHATTSGSQGKPRRAYGARLGRARLSPRVHSSSSDDRRRSGPCRSSSVVSGHGRPEWCPEGGRGPVFSTGEASCLPAAQRLSPADRPSAAPALGARNDL